ncbi:unnamed protein product, partial [Polarella glacialis]
HKNHRRILRFYRLSFGVQEPYHVLVDGTFLTHALQQKIHVKEQLPKLLEGRTTPMVTGCVLAELRSLGGPALGAAIIAKGYYRIKCGHEDAAVPAARCIADQIGSSNDRRFMVATQDLELVRAVRDVPGVPLLRLNGQVPQLEEPSRASRATAEASEEKKLRPSDWEKPKLPELQAKVAKAKALAEAPPKKRRGPKGANPLSCIKSKKEKAEKPVVAKPTVEEVQEEVKKPKRQRSRLMGNRTRDEAEARLSGSPCPIAVIKAEEEPRRDRPPTPPGPGPAAATDSQAERSRVKRKRPRGGP